MAEWTMWFYLCAVLLVITISSGSPHNTAKPTDQEHETDSPQTRKLLGSSVVTSVSVIMDHGNGTKTYITDSGSHSGDITSGQLGRPPQVVGTPGTLMAPDRYEFYTFGKEGELVKKLMTLDQIQSLIAAAGTDDEDELSDQPVYYHQPLVEAGDSEGVNKVLESVHNVLKSELEAAAAAGHHSAEVPLLPDQSWTILLPGLLNNDMDLKDPLQPSLPKKPIRPPTTTAAPLTTRFPPRRTTTTVPTTSKSTSRPSSTTHKKPTQTQTVQPSRQPTTPRLPVEQVQQQLIASPSILNPQFSLIKDTTSPTKPGLASTIKYSAHYTTPHPTLPPKQTTFYVKPQYSTAATKPSAISVKKPVMSSNFGTKTTISSSSSQANSSSNIPSTTPILINIKKTTPTTAPPITTYKASTMTPLIKHPSMNGSSQKITGGSPGVKPTTYKPATTRPQPVKYTESTKPSGIPTIVHYLPLQSMSPSNAPVHPTTPSKYNGDKIKITNNNNSNSTTNQQESTTQPFKQGSTQSRYPSTTILTTKNHYTVSNTIKNSPTSTTPIRTTQYTTKYETTTDSTASETHPSSSPLVALPPGVTIFDEEDKGNTVSVVTILEDTTRPLDISTTPGRIRPTSYSTTDKLIASLLEKEEANSVTPSWYSGRPSTISNYITSRPSVHDTSIHSTPTKTSNTRPANVKPAASSQINKKPSAASTPPRRGTVTYTPIPLIPTLSSLKHPMKNSSNIKTTTQSSTTVHRRPISTTATTTTTTKRPTTTLRTTTSPPPTTTTTTASTTTTNRPTESTAAITFTTTNIPIDTTTQYLTKMPLEQIPLKLYENLKETNRPTIFEFPSTITTEGYSTITAEDGSTYSTTDNTEAASTDATFTTLQTTMTTISGNRVVIVNNSEPFVLKQTNDELTPAASNEEPLLTEASDHTNTPSSIQTTSYTTTEETSTIGGETTPMEPMTTFKDQILEEGIHAVTSILLDGEQKKEFILNMTRPLGLFNHTLTGMLTAAPTTTAEPTTYSEINDTSEQDELSTSTMIPFSDEKSETRLDEIELTERYDESTDSAMDMSTMKEEESSSEMITVSTEKEILQSTERPAHVQVKKHIQDEIKNSLKEVNKINEKKEVKKNETIKHNETKSEIKLQENPNKINISQPLTDRPQSDEPLQMKTVSPNVSKIEDTTKPMIQKEITKKPVVQQEHKKQTNNEQKTTSTTTIRPSTTSTSTTTEKTILQQEKLTNLTKEMMQKDDSENKQIPVKLELKNQPLEDVKTKSSNIIMPTKESKLNPEMDEPTQMVEIPQKDPTNNEEVSSTTANNITPGTTERAAVVHEQIKLQEVDKYNKFNSKRPTYQTPQQELSPPVAIELHPAPYESMGLEASTAFLAEDVRRFADLCNELAFKLWTSLTSKGQISSRSLVMSPFAVTSLLAMVFLGARGATSGQMNDILRLDDMVTFNPHQVLQNVTESVLNSKNKGVATAAFVRQLYSDKSKGKLLDFYKERAQQYYQGHVEEINFSTVGDIIRRRTNLLVKRQTLGKVAEYLRGSSLNMKPPLAAFSANIFQTDCELGSTDGRDGEMYFVVRPSTRQRRLVPVPAVVWRQGFLAGYEPGLDATSVCLGPDSVVSTILILPGQQGQVAPGDGLARLEQRLIETSYRRGGWSRLLRSQLPRPGLELQVPRFSHRSVLNVTGALTRMGLRDLFGNKADLRGLNGLSNDLHLSDMVQVNTFSTCGEETVGARHHIETYPASPQRTGRDEPREYSQSLAEMLHDYSHNMQQMQQQWDSIPLALRPKQARLPDNPRLRFDRPFLYVVRHNPSGIILHMGRFNPRLLP